MIKKIIGIVAINLVLSHLCAQYFPSKTFPQNYFSNPLSIPIDLSGNFGSLRPNHFHMGWDIRTEKKEDLPVFAAADGYVAKVEIKSNGFGKVIFLQHPNGYQTVYAHLNQFYEKLDKYIQSQQAATQQWSQVIEFSPLAFPVTKGALIGFSGNTGSSQAPHLHFEIRDKNNLNLNPFLFNFDLQDTAAPLIQKLVWYGRQNSTYQQLPTEIQFKIKDTQIVLKDSIVYIPDSLFSFGVQATDKIAQSNFNFGIHNATIWMDSNFVFGFRLNEMGYYETGYINALIDYPYWRKTKTYIYHLSKLPGNHLSIYANRGDGIIALKDSLPHFIEIDFGDAHGNKQHINFWIQRKIAPSKKLFAKNNPAKNNFRGIPNEPLEITTKGARFEFFTHNFFDTTLVRIDKSSSKNKLSFSPIFQLSPATVPLQFGYKASIKANKKIPSSLKDKILMQLRSPYASYAVKGEWQGDSLAAYIEDFGKLELVLDTVAPRIKSNISKRNAVFYTSDKLLFSCSDNLAGGVQLKAFLNLQWIPLEQKGQRYSYVLSDSLTEGIQEITMIVKDKIGNTKTENLNFTFLKGTPPILVNKQVFKNENLKNMTQNPLKEGEKMPSFVSVDQNGKFFSSNSLKGKNVILYFYPEDDTPGCTQEACNLRDNYDLLKKAGLTIIGVSPNTITDHKKFEEKYTLPFTLLADPKHDIIDKFGVWGEKNMYGKKFDGLHRTTFIINSKGIIEKVFLRPKSKVHTQEILKAWETIKNKK